jgi:hypothetical protein
MRDRINDWLKSEPIPPDLRARVMTDRRLAGGGGRGVVRSRLAVATAALVVLVVGAGLASVLLRGTPPGGPVGAVSTSPTAGSTPETSPSPSDSLPAVTPTPPAPGMTLCLTADLGVAIGHSQGAAGTIYVPFDVTNHATHICTVSGYFGMALVDPSGKRVGSDPTRDPAPTPAPGAVTLAPGAMATFTFHWSQVQGSSTPCAPAAQVELTAPNQSDHVFIPARTADGATIAPCYPGGSGLTVVQPKA